MNSEIVKDYTYYLPVRDIKASLVICVWNTSHLLKRSIETYCKQDFPAQEWELIVIDDNSLDDVQEAIKFGIGKINMRYVRLEHNYGMRGNTKAFNTGFSMAKGDIIMESTPEIMFTPDTVRVMYEPHLTNDRCFVATKTHNLIAEDQILIDTLDWRKDVELIRTLPHFNEPWTQSNVANTHFGTHQSCSIRKSVWYEITKGFGFPLFGDYGSDDPWYCGLRERTNVEDITIMHPMIFHQWHLPFNYFASMGYAPMLNKWNHSMENYMDCTSGEVPVEGTAIIWDNNLEEKPEGRNARMNPEEMAHWKDYDQKFIDTGGLQSIIKR